MRDGELFLSNSSAFIEHLNITSRSIKLLNTTGTVAGEISLTMDSFENLGPLITTTDNLFLHYKGLDALQNKDLLKANGKICISTVTQFENRGWIEGKNGGHIEAMEFINAENSVVMFRDKPLKITVASQNNLLLSRASTIFAGSLEITDQNDEKYKYRIQDLERGYGNLTRRIDLIYRRDGWIVRHFIRTGNKRGGFGLYRGFGEMMMSYHKRSGDWTEEIMNAVDAIEDYYREM